MQQGGACRTRVWVHERVLKQVCIYFLLHDFRVSDDYPTPDSLRELSPAGLYVFTHESLASSNVPTGKKEKKKDRGPTSYCYTRQWM